MTEIEDAFTNPKVIAMVRALAREVAATFEFANTRHWSATYDVDGLTKSDDGDWSGTSSAKELLGVTVVDREELELAAWEAMAGYDPADWKFLRSTVKRDMIDHARKLIRREGFTTGQGVYSDNEDHAWGRAHTLPAAEWMSGGLSQDSDRPARFDVAAVAAECPTIAAVAEHGSRAAAAEGLGVSKSTIDRRYRAEIDRMEQTGRLAELEDVTTFRPVAKRCSGPSIPTDPNSGNAGGRVSGYNCQSAYLQGQNVTIANVTPPKRGSK